MTYKNMPCVYWRDGDRCSKFTDDEYDSFCVLGPCSAMRPSNADRIRSLSDEELAEYLSKVQGDIFRGEMRLTPQWLDWLKSPVEAKSAARR